MACIWYDIFTVVDLWCKLQVRAIGEMFVPGCYCVVLPHPLVQVIPAGLV